MGKGLHVVLLAIVLTCTSAEDADDKGATVSETVTIAPPGEEQVEEKIDTEKRSSDNNFCFVQGVMYNHGDIFTGHNPCIKYRCEFGVHRVVQDGCNFRQHHTCIPVNAETEINCVTYRCTRRTDNNFYFYKIDPIYSAKCKDYYGRCRRPGEVFPYALGGRLYRNCVCRPLGPLNIQYECHSS
ncbi:uncharacterized protein LOC112568087 [Pomacea canaliculata]|uniref:uncharacterized protein LOC112568087 n=1 Tax=Pomacea canaliculata TaxID=400727 RepID=UPI000D72BB54|nr:uncharacterized protein LOC112568087 [Pomacea canaliculata]XP_025100970.1 uncharacterized protein LOC112568087 [Pomacea canaliculata]